MSEPAACIWTPDYDWSAWETTCGNAFVILEGNPTENDMHFCCYCGRPLVAVIPAHIAEDEL